MHDNLPYKSQLESYIEQQLEFQDMSPVLALNAISTFISTEESTATTDQIGFQCESVLHKNKRYFGLIFSRYLWFREAGITVQVDLVLYYSSFDYDKTLHGCFIKDQLHKLEDWKNLVSQHGSFEAASQAIPFHYEINQLIEFD